MKKNRTKRSGALAVFCFLFFVLFSHAGQKRESDRMLAVARLGQGLARWSKNRKAHALSRLFAGSAMVAAENDVRERTCRALREAGEGACRAQQTAVEVGRKYRALCITPPTVY